MTAQEKNDRIEIQATSSAPADISWIEYQRAEQQGTLKRLEETARYLSGLTSISLTLIVGGNHELLRQFNTAVLFRIGLAGWLLSIFCSLAAVFPFRYIYLANSADSIRKSNNKAARIKLCFLVAAALFYLVGISIFAWLFCLVQVDAPKSH